MGAYFAVDQGVDHSRLSEVATDYLRQRGLYLSRRNAPAGGSNLHATVDQCWADIVAIPAPVPGGVYRTHQIAIGIKEPSPNALGFRALLRVK